MLSEYMPIGIRTGLVWPYNVDTPSFHSRKSATYSTYWLIRVAFSPLSPLGSAAGVGVSVRQM